MDREIPSPEGCAGILLAILLCVIVVVWYLVLRAVLDLLRAI